MTREPYHADAITQRVSLKDCRTEEEIVARVGGFIDEVHEGERQKLAHRLSTEEHDADFVASAIDAFNEEHAQLRAQALATVRAVAREAGYPSADAPALVLLPTGAVVSQALYESVSDLIRDGHHIALHVSDNSVHVHPACDADVLARLAESPTQLRAVLRAWRARGMTH